MGFTRYNNFANRHTSNSSVAQTAIDPVLELEDVLNGVNKMKVINAVTGDHPEIRVIGPDPDIDMHITSKGTGDVEIHDDLGNRVTRFEHVVAGTSNLLMLNSTANAPILGAENVSKIGDIDLVLQTQDNGNFHVQNDAGTRAFSVDYLPSTVSRLRVSTAADGGPVVMEVAGSGAFNDLVLRPRNDGSKVRIKDRSDNDALVVGQPGTNSVNYIEVVNAPTGTGVTLKAEGADADIDLILLAKGDGHLGINNLADTNGNLTLDSTPAVTGGNHLRILAADGAQPDSPQLQAVSEGIAVNVGIDFVALGTGKMRFMNAAGVQMFEAAHVTNAVNFIQIKPAIVNGDCEFVCVGTSTKIDMNFVLKGTGVYRVRNDIGGGVDMLVVRHVTNAIDELAIFNGTAAAGPKMKSQGTSTNVDLTFEMKGTGRMMVGIGGIQSAKLTDIEIDGDLDHDGTNIGFFGTAPVAKAAALSAIDAATVDLTYGAEEAGVINNIRARLNELESRLQAYGLQT